MNIDTIEKPKVDINDKNSNIKKVVLHNDDYNSFEHVEGCLMRHLGYNLNQSKQIAMTVHFRGKCTIIRGSEEKMNIIHKKLQKDGLTVTIKDD